MKAIRPGLGRLATALCLLVLGFAATATAQTPPAFPDLTGRVVDQAELLSPAAETRIIQRLEALERDTTDQLVVVTVPNLQDRDIADYGYQLGRAWRIGKSEVNNGALLIVAPNERKVRIEVGYGLEPILTDAMSALIIQNQILPAFRDGDFERGIEAGVVAIDRQLRLDPEEARARAAEAAQTQAEAGSAMPAIPVVLVLFVLVLFFVRLISGGRGRRSRRNGILVWGAAEALSQMSRGRGSSWGGGGFGGGGFGGGGGSFGGGGASGGW